MHSEGGVPNARTYGARRCVRTARASTATGRQAGGRAPVDRFPFQKTGFRTSPPWTIGRFLPPVQPPSRPISTFVLSISRAPGRPRDEALKSVLMHVTGRTFQGGQRKERFARQRLGSGLNSRQSIEPPMVRQVAPLTGVGVSPNRHRRPLSRGVIRIRKKTQRECASCKHRVRACVTRSTRRGAGLQPR